MSRENRPPSDDGRTSPPGYSVAADTRVKLPLVLLWSIVVTSALVGGYVINLRGEVSDHTSEIRALKEEARMTRELLVRIDENVKDLKAARQRE